MKFSMSKIGLSGSVLAVATALSCISTPVSAQEAEDDVATEVNEPIIVTARFREETVQDIGAAITAFGTEQIENAGLTDFEDIARRTVGLNLVDRGPNQNDIAIRGIANGVPPQTADGGNMAPLVTQYFDDILFSSTTAAQRDIALFDVQRVEVLRGPQPTLFGEGAVGGAIRYFSTEPSLSGISGKFQAAVEDTEHGAMSYRVQGAVGAALVPDVLGIRVMGYYRDDGGFIDNPVLGVADANDFESYGGRAVLLFEPSSDFKARLSAHIQRDTPGEDWSIDAGNNPDELTFSTAVPADRYDDLDIYSGKLTYDAGAVELTSITGYVKRDSYRNTFDPGNTGGIGFLYPQIEDPSVFSSVAFRQRNFTQEFRLVTQFDGPVNFVSGFLYSDNDVSNVVDVTSPGLAALVNDPTDILPGNSVFYQLNDILLEQYSGFLEFTISPSDQLNFIAGMRYVDQDQRSILVSTGAANIGSPAPVGATDFVYLLNEVLGLGSEFGFHLKELLPRVGLEFKPNPDLMLYANAAKGVRNGGLNSPLSAIGAPNGFNDAIAFDQDSVWAYELGVKSTMLDGDLTLNAAAFLNEFNNPQIQFVPVATQLYANGPDSRALGFEVETAYRVSPNFSIYANGIYNDAEFTETESLGAAGVIEKGNRPQGVSKYAFSTGADVDFPIGQGPLRILGHADLQYVGHRYSTPQNFESSKLGAMTLVNARIGLASEAWKITAYVNNLTNAIEYQSLAVLNTLANAPVTAASVNRPRTFGLSVDFNF